MEKKGGQGIKSISHVSRNGTAKKKCALVADGSSVAQEGDVSPDCAILRGFLAKEEEKSDWHPLEHKDGKRECRPHQIEKSKVLAMKNPTGDAPKATAAANIPTSQAASTSSSGTAALPAPVTIRLSIAIPHYKMQTPLARHQATQSRN